MMEFPEVSSLTTGDIRGSSRERLAIIEEGK
jgi:hypothetical protein